MARPCRDSAPSIEHRLREAFWSLVLEPGARVSVSALCALAGCNRTSFYYHYVDAGELVREALEGEYRGPSGFRELALFLACEYGDDEDGLRLALSLVNPGRLRAADRALGSGFVGGFVRDLVVADWTSALGDQGASDIGRALPLVEVVALALVSVLMDPSVDDHTADPFVARCLGRSFDLVRAAAGLQ